MISMKLVELRGTLDPGLMEKTQSVDLILG
jgi:hypothetical protein